MHTSSASKLNCNNWLCNTVISSSSFSFWHASSSNILRSFNISAFPAAYYTKSRFMYHQPSQHNCKQRNQMKEELVHGHLKPFPLNYLAFEVFDFICSSCSKRSLILEQFFVLCNFSSSCHRNLYTPQRNWMGIILRW